MDAVEFLDRLEFYDDRFFDQEIDLRLLSNLMPSYLERRNGSAAHGQSSSYQASCQDVLIDRFEESWAEPNVNSVRGINDLAGNRIDVHASPLRVPAPPRETCAPFPVSTT